MGKPIEEHMADFLIDQHKLGLAVYCRRCLEFWKLEYGEATTRRVETMLRKHFAGKKGGSNG